MQIAMARTLLNEAASVVQRVCKDADYDRAKFASEFRVFLEERQILGWASTFRLAERLIVLGRVHADDPQIRSRNVVEWLEEGAPVPPLVNMKPLKVAGRIMQNMHQSIDKLDEQVSRFVFECARAGRRRFAMQHAERSGLLRKELAVIDAIDKGQTPAQDDLQAIIMSDDKYLKALLGMAQKTVELVIPALNRDFYDYLWARLVCEAQESLEASVTLALQLSVATELPSWRPPRWGPAMDADILLLRVGCKSFSYCKRYIEALQEALAPQESDHIVASHLSAIYPESEELHENLKSFVRQSATAFSDSKDYCDFVSSYVGIISRASIKELILGGFLQRLDRPVDEIPSASKFGFLADVFDQELKEYITKRQHSQSPWLSSLPGKGREAYISLLGQFFTNEAGEDRMAYLFAAHSFPSKRHLITIRTVRNMIRSLVAAGSIGLANDILNSQGAESIIGSSLLKDDEMKTYQQLFQCFGRLKAFLENPTPGGASYVLQAEDEAQEGVGRLFRQLDQEGDKRRGAIVAYCELPLFWGKHYVLSELGEHRRDFVHLSRFQVPENSEEREVQAMMSSVMDCIVTPATWLAETEGPDVFGAVFG